MPIIHLLSPEPRRHAELRRGLPGVSQRMLTRTLRRLEARGLLGRTVNGTVPPRVEYALTPLGRSLNEPLQTLCHWTERHADELSTVLGEEVPDVSGGTQRRAVRQR